MEEELNGLKDFFASRNETFYSLQPVVSRTAWNSTADYENADKFPSKPLTTLAITTIRNLCGDKSACASSILQLLEESFEQDLHDIPFNFIVTPFGTFEGRGWNVLPETIDGIAEEFYHIGVLTEITWLPEGSIKEILESIQRDGFVLGNSEISEIIVKDGCASSDCFIKRSEWGARETTGLIPLTSPSKKYVISFRDDLAEGCKSLETCSQALREMQESSFASGMDDLPYNFIIGGDGYIYEGRGKDFQGEIVRPDYINYKEREGLLIAFITDFSSLELRERQMEAFRLHFMSDFTVNDFIVSEDQLKMLPLAPDADRFLEELSELPEVPEFIQFFSVYPRSVWQEGFDFDYTHAALITEPKSFYHHSDIPDSDCTIIDECIAATRALHNAHRARGLRDINYNFIIGPFGVIECRGWYVESEDGGIRLGYIRPAGYREIVIQNMYNELNTLGVLLGHIK